MHKIISIQILRFIAAWMVVYHHYIQLYERSHDEGLAWFFYKRGAFGVDLFFVISGFIMYITLTKGRYCAGTFITNRLIRIIPAYWFYSSVVILTSYLLYKDIIYSPGFIISSLLFFPYPHPSGIGYYPALTVGWTLNFELFFYIILTACTFLVNRYKFIACSVVLLALPITKIGNYGMFQAYAPILNDMITYEFVSGLFIGYLYIKFPNLFSQKTLLIPLFIFFIGVFLLLSSDTRKIWIFSSSAFVFSLLGFEKYLYKIKPKFLTLMGDISYSTYLIHTIIINLFKNYTHFNLSLINQELTLLLCLTLSIGFLSWISYKTIEQYPIKIYKKIKNRPSRNPENV